MQHELTLMMLSESQRKDYILYESIHLIENTNQSVVTECNKWSASVGWGQG